MEGNSEQDNKQDKQTFDWLKAYQWQKGQSGNPGGRPKKTMKVFAREFLEAMSDEDRIAYFKTLPSDLVWRMAEGNPENKTDLTSGGKPIPILGGIKTTGGTENVPTDNINEQDSIS